MTYRGVDPQELDAVLRTGVDHAGHPVEPFADPAGGWPLRCCLSDSAPGDRVAIIAFSPFPWTSPYRAIGPVVVHADPCPGPSGRYPAQFDGRDQVVRAFGDDGERIHTQVYDRHRLVRAGGGLPEAIAEALSDPRVEFVQASNVLAGCYSFTATRA